MSRQSTRKEVRDGRRRKPKPYQVGVKIPCGVHPQVPEKSAVGGNAGHLGEVFRKLAEQKESRIEEGQLLPDHVHMMIAIPPQYAVSQVIEFTKGKSALHLPRVYGETNRNFVGQHFWARGYCVSTVGRDETAIREYIRQQGAEDKRLDQINLWR